MATAKFTRDEVILALDVLYNSKETVSPTSAAISELSGLLHKLPVYSESQRRIDFRNTTGISHQLTQFRTSYSQGKKAQNVGELFYIVADEFINNLPMLHAIAEAIRHNLPYFTGTYGAEEEADGFPEGALLGHLHRTIERRDGVKAPRAPRCAICQLEPEALYQPCGALLEQHLLVPPTELDGGNKYKPGDFITVCPNCHAALHRYRPWLNKENCGGLLRG